ncbi:uncharacterized protein LOC117125096 [Anneissia japonica]|uniref:uncharacterized protein LOC117125096 n=1 Tax=Anneissia japonica TaxID=1529436 RepID=UPI0014258583|nr:uncharacterized protein LOC117125096 [Anneissia japonica]
MIQYELKLHIKMDVTLLRKQERQKSSKESPQQKSSKGEKYAKFIQLIGRLQLHYQSQLSPSLIAMNKFTKSTKYFIQALRSIKPHDSQRITSLRMVQSGLASCRLEHGDKNSWVIILESFLMNVQNFRILRQQVKMDIFMKLKALPQELENVTQARSRGELEVLLNTWSTLVDLDHDLSRLEHASVVDYSKHFQNDLDMNSVKGVLSLLPKLSDILNRIDFLLTKYQM